MGYLRELVRHRDLLFWLTVKDIKVRYKSPALGVLWALLVPSSLSLILWLVFTYILPVAPAQPPFFLFLIVAMFPWHFFSQSVAAAPMSVLEAGPLIRKHPFPRALIPLSIVAANFFHFICALAVVLGILLAAGLRPGFQLWVLPVAVGLQLLLTSGMVLLIAGLQVQFRDVKFLTDVGLTLWFYVTPIFYPLERILSGPPPLASLYLLNPMVWIVELYRIALLGASSGGPGILASAALGIAGVLSVACLAAGLLDFRRREATLADVVLG